MPTTTELLEPFYLSDDPEEVLAAVREVTRASSGQVKNPEGLLPRTLKPERGGVLCASIFGPVEDWSCVCGFLRTPEKAGECPKCGVLCGEKRLRDERWGHVAVAWPVLHPVLATHTAEIMGCDQKELRKLAAEMARTHTVVASSVASASIQSFATLVERGGGELMLAAVPVTPPGWRGTKRDAQDLMFARLVNRANRLQRLIELAAPDIILDNEYRETQKTVDRVWKTVRAEVTARRARVVVPRDGRHAELLQAVHEQPLDYSTRGVYADWLIEQGDPRGEFITLQLANPDKPMGKRESELLARHYTEWMAPLGDAVDYVVFKRGFLAGCRAQKPALAFVGDSIWSTVEHLNTELVEIVRQPEMRALTKLSTNMRCLAKLCAEAPLPQLAAVNVRISSCPPKGHEAVTAKTLPNVRELVVLHQTATGTSDWSWLLGTPLARQLTRLTLGMALERLDALSIADWLPVFAAHPKLERLALSYDKKRLIFELVRASKKRVEIELTTTRSLVERSCLMTEDTITPAISQALKRLPKGVKVNAEGNSWFGPGFVSLAKTLERRLPGAVTVPEIRPPA